MDSFPILRRFLNRLKGVKKIPRLLAKCEVLYLMFEVGLSQLNGGHHPWTSSSKMQGRSNTNFKKDEKEPRTFTSCCPSCMVSCSIYEVYENQLLLCHKCQSTFVPHDLSIEGVQPESSGYKFADHKDSPSQGRSEVASQSNDGTENPSVTRFNGNAALSPVSKARTAADGSRGSYVLRLLKRQSATKKEQQNAAVTDGVFTRDRPTDSAAAAAVDRYKKEHKQKVSASREAAKNCKTGEFELEVKKAVMPCNNETKSRADAASGPNSNIPDPEFNIFRANQTWALYAPEDGMPRFYALVKKVYTSGFKLKITWLEPNPNDQGEIAWCNKELPVACGKYTLGHSEEITNHLMFSHQMHFRRGRGRNSFLVYPRKGETWALYHNWDIGWSCEPEKHVPNKFEYVEVLQDFKQDVGIEVAYLGKAKGFVSLFKKTEMRRVVSFQVPPNEL